MPELATSCAIEMNISISLNAQPIGLTTPTSRYPSPNSTTGAGAPSVWCGW
jgi:hypothetical protein